MTLYIILGIIALIVFIYIFCAIKRKVWDEPRRRITSLEEDLKKSEEINKRTIKKLDQRLNNLNSINLHLVENEFNTIVNENIWEKASFCSNLDKFGIISSYSYRSRVLTKSYLEALADSYKLKFIIFLYPELKDVFIDTEYNENFDFKISNLQGDLLDLFECVKTIGDYKFRDYYFEKKAKRTIEELNKFIETSKSNLTAIPYMSALMADYLTIDFELLAKSLDWGHNQQREKKVASIRQLRAEAKDRIEACKYAEYQLKYLIELYPELEDIIETEFSEIKITSLEELPEHDTVRDYLSKEEYAKLSSIEKNQLALDRYIEGHNKSKWQIGRDYELYIGYVYEQKGYTVDYFGSYMKLEDLGRDLIAIKNDMVEIVQCKYWGQEKVIREKHITQLFGTTVCYCMDNNIPQNKVKAVLITNTDISETAKKFAQHLGVEIRAHIPMGNFPRIKCNIGKEGEKIYHLPFDLQYDATKIDKPGEFMALTVKEAENAGFRRSFKWFGT